MDEDTRECPGARKDRKVYGGCAAKAIAMPGEVPVIFRKNPCFSPLFAVEERRRYCRAPKI